MYTEIFIGKIYVELASKHCSKEKSEWGVNEKKKKELPDVDNGGALCYSNLVYI